jgi:hypothetical protein
MTFLQNGDLEMEHRHFERESPRFTSASALKERLLGELLELNRQNGEITAQLRAIRHLEKSIANGLDLQQEVTASAARLARACRIALLESDEPQSVGQIHARIQRRNSFYFSAAPEKALSMIGRTLAEIAARGEIRCNAGAWERAVLTDGDIEIAHLPESH